MSFQRSVSAHFPLEDSPLLTPSAPPYVNREYQIPLRSTSADQVSVTIDPPTAYAHNNTRPKATITETQLADKLNVWYRVAIRLYSKLLSELNYTSCISTITFWMIIFTFICSFATLIILILHVYRGDVR